MQVKSLRQHKNWSQEQLAQLSGLNVRTIQRIEKGESVGLETLKSLAAVFEISVSDLKCQSNSENESSNIQEAITKPSELGEQKSLAKEKMQSIKHFYITLLASLGLFVFIFLPNYNQGENLGPLIVVAISFALMLGVYANAVFQPFGHKWEQKKIKQIMNEQDNNINKPD
jgi:transcriptional regulator with XRE-family HTH domain